MNNAAKPKMYILHFYSSCSFLSLLGSHPFRGTCHTHGCLSVTGFDHLTGAIFIIKCSLKFLTRLHHFFCLTHSAIPPLARIFQMLLHPSFSAFQLFCPRFFTFCLLLCSSELLEWQEETDISPVNTYMFKGIKKISEPTHPHFWVVLVKTNDEQTRVCKLSRMLR